MNNIYQENGYDNRDEYLRDLADDYGVDLAVVLDIAELLGEQEDFDGLVVALEDYALYMECTHER